MTWGAEMDDENDYFGIRKDDVRKQTVYANSRKTRPAS